MIRYTSEKLSLKRWSHWAVVKPATPCSWYKHTSLHGYQYAIQIKSNYNFNLFNQALFISETRFLCRKTSKCNRSKIKSSSKKSTAPTNEFTNLCSVQLEFVQQWPTTYSLPIFSIKEMLNFKIQCYIIHKQVHASAMFTR